MAWPPAALPANRTNSTPQLDNHVFDHNSLAQAMNDTTSYLQSRFAGLDGTLADHEIRIARTYMNGFALNGRLLIQGGGQTATTDGNGTVSIVYPQLFTGPALAIPFNISNLIPVVAHPFDMRDNLTQILFRWIDTALPFVNQGITFEWIAIGTRIP